MFTQAGLARLIEFCRRNPDYHIVSWTCGLYVNRLLPEAPIFYLAEGCDDPELAFAIKHLSERDLEGEA